MGNWDDESDEEVATKVTAPIVAVPKRRFDDEDKEEEVADDWDASSDDEANAPAAPVAAPRKKGSLKAKIAAKEAEKTRRLEAGESEEEESEIDELEQKRRDKQREIETDLVNATSLLSGTSISAGAQSAEIQGITSLNPKTKDEFTELSDRLIELIQRHQDKPLYSTFVELHVRALAQPLKDVDVRKAASALTTLANEKQKEQRDKASGKKKPKATAKPGLGGAKSSSKVDTGAYEEALDDFGNDDFM